MKRRYDHEHPSHATLNLRQQIVAASSGGALITLLVTPFDVVKARLQAQVDTRVGIGQASTTPALRFTSTTDAFIKIAKFEGIRGLWRGLNATFVMTVPRTALYFCLYERLKDKIDEYELCPVYAEPAISGLLSRTITAIALSPLEYVRTYLQSHSAKEKMNEGMISTYRTLIRNGGVLSLWGGLVPTLIRDLPFSVVYWSGYELCKEVMRPRLGDSFSMHFIAGAAAGMAAASVTTPIDVIKTRRQMYLETEKVAKRTIEIYRQIVCEEGWRSLFKGLVPRVAKVAPACALMISSYELFKQILAAQPQKPQVSMPEIRAPAIALTQGTTGQMSRRSSRPKNT